MTANAPKIICIGGQKCGTDWLFDQLAAHSAFWKPPFKEIGYFDDGFGDLQYDRARTRLKRARRRHVTGKKDMTFEIAFLLRLLGPRSGHDTAEFSYYFNLFENKPGFVADCTPGYCLVDATIAGQMYDQMPDTKFILFFRNPVDRLWSQTQMHVRLNNDSAPANTDFEAFKDFATQKYVQRMSRLSVPFGIWDKIDTQGRFAVADFDDIKYKAELLRSRICDFLEIEDATFDHDAGFNKKATQTGKVDMPADFRAYATDLLGDEITLVDEILKSKRNLML